MTVLKNELQSFFKVYGAIFFLGSWQVGALIALFTLAHPNIGVCGLICAGVTALLLRAFSFPLSSAIASASILNALLAGLYLGDLFLLNPTVFVLLVFMAAFNLAVTASLENAFRSFGWPVLSIPFSILAVGICILSSRFAWIPEARIYDHAPFVWEFIPDQLKLFFASLSSIFCAPDSAMGLLIWIAVAVFSPMTALFLLAGYFLGTFFEGYLTIGSSFIAGDFRYIEGFNYSLVFAAMAGCFLTTNLFSLSIAAVGVLFCVFALHSLEILLAPIHLPVMAVPFNMITMTGLLAIRSLRPGAMATAFFETPEARLEKARLLWNRYRFGEPGIFLPVAGRWEIQQGFEGEYTHKGLWKHAFDFVLNEPHKNQGFELSDYPTFGKDVIAPMNGYVVSLQNDEPDNLIGQVVNSKNWGNFVILRGDTGLSLTLAHLKKGTIAVAIGDRVSVGQKVGEVGNSGYSQHPHLHLQAQWSPAVGAITTPFHLINYSSNGAVCFHGVPKTKEVIESLSLNQAVEKAFNFRVQEIIHFEKFVNNHPVGEVKIHAAVDEHTGAFYLSHDKNRMTFARTGSQFYFYDLHSSANSILWDLYGAASRVPMIFGKKYSYSDELPADFALGYGTRMLSSFLQMFGLSGISSLAHFQIDELGMSVRGKTSMRGKQQDTFLKIDPALGIEQFSVGNRKYVRKK